MAVLLFTNCEDLEPDQPPGDVTVTIENPIDSICQRKADSIDNDDKDIIVNPLAICDEVIVDKSSSIYTFFIDKLTQMGIVAKEVPFCDCNPNLVLIDGQGVDLIGAVESAKGSAGSIGAPPISPNIGIDISQFDLPTNPQEEPNEDGDIGQNPKPDSTVYYVNSLLIPYDLSQFDNFISQNPSGGTHRIGINDSGTDTRDQENVLRKAGWTSASKNSQCFNGSPDEFGINIPFPSAGPTDYSGHGVAVNSIFLNKKYVNPEGGNFEFINTKFTKRSSNRGTLADLLCGMYYLIGEGANPINVSAGFDTKQDRFPLIEQVVRLAESKGIILVAGTGNGKKNSNGIFEGQVLGGNLHFEPARTFSNSDHGIAVGATNTTQTKLATFSNWSSGSEMTLAAQGEDLVCLFPGYITSSLPDSEFRFIKRRGTSFATPQVTGTVAAILEKVPCIPPNEIKEILINSGQVISDPNTGDFILLDHNAAIALALSSYNCTQ
ncbi:MAG: S8/S53 family peptidase [Bacteroidota bacterium]